MAAINDTQINSIQSYYMEHSQTMYERTFTKPALQNFMSVTAKDKLLLPGADASTGLQSYQAGHHTKGGVTFTGRKLEMRTVKSDTLIEDTRLFDTDAYYAFMVRNGNDPKDFPFEAYVIQMLLDSMYEAFQLDVLWNGIYKSPIPGAPNNPGDTADGLRKLLRDEWADGNLPMYATGQSTSANTVDLVRDFVYTNLNTVALRNRQWALYCSQTFMDNYHMNYEDAIGSYRFADDAFRLMKVHGAQGVTLVPQDGLPDNALILARPDNATVGFDGPPALNLDYESRQLKIEYDWKYATQWHSMTEVFVNEWI